MEAVLVLTERSTRELVDVREDEWAAIRGDGDGAVVVLRSGHVIQVVESRADIRAAILATYELDATPST